MPDGFDDTALTHSDGYRRGDQLVYRVTAKGPQSAAEVAEDLGRIADIHDLGDWSVSPIGVGRDAAYFDLELHRDTCRVYVKLIIGLDPDVY